MAQGSKKYKVSALAIVMNYAVSGYVYFVALTLVIFMVSSLIAGLFGLATGLLDLASTPSGILSAPERVFLEKDLLHTIAFTIVLVKAYKILIAFAETRHINLKFLVEISIIAPTIELIFNTSSYAFEVQALFATFAVINLTVYLFFYKTLKKVSDDYIKEWEQGKSIH